MLSLIHRELSKGRDQVPELTEETSFAELLCDPLDMLCILQAIEEKHGDICERAFEACQTIGDLVMLVGERV